MEIYGLWETSQQQWCGSQIHSCSYCVNQCNLSMLVENKRTHKNIFPNYLLGIYSGITHARVSYYALTRVLDVRQRALNTIQQGVGWLPRVTCIAGMKVEFWDDNVPVCFSFLQLLATKSCCGLSNASAFQPASIKFV
jgi:hypothetical protein